MNESMKVNEKDKLIIGVESVIDILSKLVSDSKNDKDYLIKKLDFLIHKEDPKVSSILNENDVISFDDLLFLIDNGFVSKMLLGTKVYIPNPKSLCNTWIIVDINAEGTKNTVELRSYTSALFTYFGYNAEYFKSNVFDKLNELAAYFPKNVRDRMCQMHIFSEPNFRYNQNIKLPSMTELGFRGDFCEGCSLTEGTEYKYPLYLLKYVDENFEGLDNSGGYVPHMTRTRFHSTRADGPSKTSIYVISSDGSIRIRDCSSEKFGAAPIIRIG